MKIGRIFWQAVNVPLALTFQKNIETVSVPANRNEEIIFPQWISQDSVRPTGRSRKSMFQP